VALPQFFISMVADLSDDEDVRDPTISQANAESRRPVGSPQAGSLPAWLRAALEAAAVDKKVPEAFYRAMDWVWAQEVAFVPPRLLAEMVSMGDGVCAGLAKARPALLPCNTTEWAANVQRVNMLPELIKMTCTMFGAWGGASASGHLLQLRALDFGSSPLANFTLLAVHRPLLGGGAVAGGNAQAAAAGATAVAQRARGGGDSGDLWQAFATVGFPGLVGVVTGVSQFGVGLSEKVWEVSNGTATAFGNAAVQPGAYDGEV
jgi:hypothetical protein